MRDKSWFLYKVTNILDGKLYIGVTKNFQSRKRQHTYSFKQKKGLLSRAINKYGKENFVFEVICEGSESYIYELETKAIILYNTNVTTGHGYNISSGGKGGEGTKIRSRADDKPIYVKGFWFPNKRTCTSKLKIPYTTLQDRLAKGTAGDLMWQYPNTRVGTPVYISGFWFSDIFLASYLLQMEADQIKSRINIGAVEQFVGTSGRPRRKIYVEGVVYNSLATASKESRYTRKMLYRRVDNDPTNFYYIE